MGIFTKTLPELVGKILAKEEQMTARISELEGNIRELNNSIQSKANELVNYELSNDTESQQQCKDAIKSYRSQIVELEDLLGAYKTNLNSYSVPESDLVKIKEAAKKEQKARSEKIQANQTKIEQAKSQIKKLQSSVNDLKEQNNKIINDKSELKEIEKVIKYIDPMANQLRSKTGFISAWINDGDTEQCFIIEGLKQPPRNLASDQVQILHDEWLK